MSIHLVEFPTNSSEFMRICAKQEYQKVFGSPAINDNNRFIELVIL